MPVLRTEPGSAERMRATDLLRLYPELGPEELVELRMYFARIGALDFALLTMDSAVAEKANAFRRDQRSHIRRPKDWAAVAIIFVLVLLSLVVAVLVRGY